MSAKQTDLSVGEGWQHASLGKLLPLKYGKSLPAQLRDPNGTHPVYGSSGVVGAHSAALTNGPTLIVGRKGNVGAIHYSAVPCWPIDTAYFVEAPAGHNLRYYKYLLESLNLVKLDRSTAIPGLSRDDYNAVEVSVAPPAQQDEIVAEIEKQFSRLDEAVANLQRVKANLKRYKDSVYSEAFRNAPNSTLGELIEVGPQNGLYLPKDMYGDGVPILRIDDYQTAWIRPVQELRRVKATQEQISTCALCEDDLVVNRVNSMTHLGKCVRIPKSLAGTVFESNMMRMRLPYPTTRDAVLARLQAEALIVPSESGWAISNMAAILLAKRLDAFSPALARKAARVIIYEGTNKLNTKDDKPGLRGYAVGFGSLVDFVHSAAPQNRFVEQAVREEVKMFPKQALRELIANALVHQDFLASGASVMIELYADRVEISNPGLPPIKVERFIDEYRSRNERLADLMRRLGICEEKGSGVDKVIHAAEMYQLPAPDFRVGEMRTTALLFAHQDFADMSKGDRVRACYQHCCLMYVTNQRMSNQSLRLRFGLGEDKTVATSQVIGAAKEAGLIKADESETTSTRYARYLPFWA